MMFRIIFCAFLFALSATAATINDSSTGIIINDSVIALKNLYQKQRVVSEGKYVWMKGKLGNGEDAAPSINVLSDIYVNAIIGVPPIEYKDKTSFSTANYNYISAVAVMKSLVDDEASLDEAIKRSVADFREGIKSSVEKDIYKYFACMEIPNLIKEGKKSNQKLSEDFKKASVTSNTFKRETSVKKSVAEIFKGNKTPKGFRNFGNSCYFNSMAQAALASPSFREYLSKVSDQSKDADRKNFAREFLSSYNTQPGSIEGIFKKYNAQHFKFNAGSQADADEVFVKMSEFVSNYTFSEGNLKQKNVKDDLFVSPTFFKIFKALKCPVGHVTQTGDPSEKVAVELEQTDLIGMLTMYCAEGKEQYVEWNCTGCGKESSFKERYALESPKLLVIQLKRFIQTGLDSKGCAVTSKKNNNVTFPEYFSMTVNEERHEYVLASVINHYGTLSGGHYTAHVRGSEGRWYLANDSSVTQEMPTGGSQPFLLFYERVDE